jgi:hypothetical protein
MSIIFKVGDRVKHVMGLLGTVVSVNIEPSFITVAYTGISIRAIYTHSGTCYSRHTANIKKPKVLITKLSPLEELI